MFIFMFIMLTVGQLAVEQMIVRSLVEVQSKIPYLRGCTSFRKIHARYVVINLAFSLLVSLMLASMFPAAGLIVLTSGLVSTMLSRPVGLVIDGWYMAKMAIARWWTSVVRFCRTVSNVVYSVFHPWKAYKRRRVMRRLEVHPT